MLPEHAARASELESATEAPEATVSAVVQTTLDSTMPEHAARAQELEQADTVSFTISLCVCLVGVADPMRSQADAMDVVDDP